MIDLDRMSRWSATARTWARKASRLMVQQSAAATGDERWLVGYDAEILLADLLDQAEALVPVLNDDQLDGVLQSARTVADAIRARRLAAKLEQVEGRTGPEAAAFLERAAELRGAGLVRGGSGAA